MKSVIPAPVESLFRDPLPRAKLSSGRLGHLTRMKYIGLTLVFLSGIAVAVWWWFPKKITKLGDTFPELAITDVKGQQIEWPTQTFFVVYTSASSPMGIQLLKAAHLRDQKNFETPPIITIIHGNREQIAQFTAETEVFSRIVQDKGLWSRRLGLGPSPFHLFIVDTNAQITFGTDYAEPEDLRQLSEKVLVGHVTYRGPEPESGLRIGDRFAGLSVFDLRTQQQSFFFAPTGSSVICFTSHCPACDLEQAINDYKSYEFRASGQPLPTLLFSSRFSRAELLDMINRHGIKSHVIQAVENIPGLEDPLSLETFSPTNILQIDLGPDSSVQRIVPWRAGRHAGGR